MGDGQGVSVAVPVNYGMLSYPKELLVSRTTISRSPRQLWNALLPGGREALFVAEKVAVPVNYGMLSY